MDRFEDVKLRVKEATDLVSLIGSYIPLKQKGREFTALCPFHQEKTPSFFVVPDKQFYKCFGCGKTGDVFTFVMEREGVSFREAFEMLAQRAAIPIEGVFGSRDRDTGPKVDVHATLAAVRDFFAEALAGGEGGQHRDYLHARGLAHAVEPFALGAHPTKPGRLARFAQDHRLPLEVLESAGLLRDGGRREPFLGRVMFPIEDERGRVVGFGGRVLGKADDATGPKYLNSPESPHFNKRRVLFGLRRAKLQNARRIVVMEGYTDAIACQLAGVPGAVATLGTALTPEHCRLLERYATEGVVLLFDGDAAGFRAADRAFRELVDCDVSLAIALLEGGVDPADLAAPPPDVAPEEAQRRKEQLTSILAGGSDALTVWFRLLRGKYEFGDPAQAMHAVGECAEVLGAVTELARREVLIGRMAPHLGLSSEALRRSVEKKLRPARPAPAVTPQSGQGEAEAERPGTAVMRVPDSARGRAELELLAGLIAKPELATRLDDGEPRWEGGERSAAGRVHELLLEGIAAGLLESSALVRYLFGRSDQDPGFMALLAQLADRSARIKDADDFVARALAGLRTRSMRDEALRLRAEIQDAKSRGLPEQAELLTQKYLAALRTSAVQGTNPD